MDHGRDMIDWDLAVRTARRLVPAGPAQTPAEAAAISAQLLELADAALDHVVGYTGMIPEPGLAIRTEIVDRPTWAAHNVAGMRVTLSPVLDALTAKRAEKAGRTADRIAAFGQKLGQRTGGEKAAADALGSASRAVGGAANAAGRAVTGTELGVVLSFLASRVLGQYETFLEPADGDGRLLLVAPNIVEVERRLKVDPRDFRMWVCLHEQTHRVQFTSAPWLKDHLRGLVTRLADLANLTPGDVVSRLRAAIRERGQSDDDLAGTGPLAVLQSPEQRAVLAELQAVMTLLEGHADQVMDAVGPAVVPTVEAIRNAFELRRNGGSPLDRAIRKLLGLDAKIAQYRVGGAFCRAVTDAGGTDAMRAAFAGPHGLPTMVELRDPGSWLARVRPGTAA